MRYTTGVLKFDPEIVTGVPPLLNPDAGLMNEITGAVLGRSTVNADGLVSF